MRLLVISPHLEPDTAPTGIMISAILEKLNQLGNEIHAVTSLPWYEKHEVEKNWKGKGLQKFIRTDNEKYGRVTRCYPFPSSKKSLIKRGLGFIGFTAMAAISTLFTRKKFDAVLTISPPLTLGLVGWIASRRHRCPHILNVQDVFPDVAIQVGAITSPQMIRIFKKLERLCYKKSAAISVLSEDLAENVKSKIGSIESQIVIIPNFVDTRKIVPSDRQTFYRSELNLDDQVVVMYAGNLGYSQSLDLLVEAARRHQSRRDVAYVINGSGVLAPELIKQAENLPNLSVSGFQPVARLSEVLASADIHVVLLKEGLGTSSLPSKMYSIFAAGRPVIASIDSGTEVSKILSENQAGITVEPEKLEEFISAIERLINNTKERVEMGAAGRSWVEKQPTAQMVAESYLDLFTALK
tara:strand:- start:286 stop:1518 length:1233 start_codon:yes stop_codon:yes gene_type:complete